jgi:ribosomal protein S18 acetylase RimI-like enzyme
LEQKEFQLIYPIGIRLSKHLWESPMFLRYKENPEEEKNGDPDKFAQWQIQQKIRYFAAKVNEKVIAYIKVSDEGENFVGEVNCMKHIQGAYCLPEYRGKGIVQKLLNCIIKKLQNENILLLGVDFESFNPAASGFWLKYFTEYTQSVVRRIDDRFIKQKFRDSL